MTSILIELRLLAVQKKKLELIVFINFKSSINGNTNILKYFLLQRRYLLEIILTNLTTCRLSFTFDTCDVVRSWSIFLFPSIVLDNLFDHYSYLYWTSRRTSAMDERDAKQLFTLAVPNSSGTPLYRRTYLLNI